MTEVTLQPITPDNEDAVRRLRVRSGQEGFVATNEWSLEEGAAEEHAWLRAICVDDSPVGFVMMWIDSGEGVYYVWRFMVDGSQQGLGYGGQAMNLLIEHVRPTQRDWDHVEPRAGRRQRGSVLHEIRLRIHGGRCRRGVGDAAGSGLMAPSTSRVTVPVSHPAGVGQRPETPLNRPYTSFIVWLMATSGCRGVSLALSQGPATFGLPN